MKKIIHNIETGEVTEVDLTKEEIAQFKLNQEIYKEKTKEFFDKAEAKTTAEGKLAALGLNTDDLRALGL